MEGRTNGQTDGQKQWIVEVGAPPKNKVPCCVFLRQTPLLQEVWLMLMNDNTVHTLLIKASYINRKKTIVFKY